MMEAFTEHRGVIAPLDRANVDTDQIIAKQFLKSIKRTGFGEHLFHDWRYDDQGNADPQFSLNNEQYRGASILLARNNFGCGSSREHAVWAVQQYGFRAVVAPSKGSGDKRIPAFADIFRNNSVKNGLLTVELSEEEVEKIFQLVERFPGLEALIDLAEQRITLMLDEEVSFHFDVDPSAKNRLLHGLDDIGLSLKQESAITVFESNHNPQIAG